MARTLAVEKSTWAGAGLGEEEAAGFDDAALPLGAVEVEGGQGFDGGDGFGFGEVLLGAGGFEALQVGLLGGVGAEGVLVGLVGGGPEGVANGFGGGGGLVAGGEGDGAVASAGGGVGVVGADADGDADDALVLLFLAGEGSVVGDGFVAADVVEAVLDEVGALHAGEEEGGLFAVEFGLHGVEDGVFGSMVSLASDVAVVWLMRLAGGRGRRRGINPTLSVDKCRH